MERRKYLGITTGILASGLAGCMDAVTGGDNASPNTDSKEDPSENTGSGGGSIADTRYEDGTLVVELVADHSVSALEFIHEDGSLITDARVGTQTKVELQEMIGGPTGEHSITAIDDEGEKLGTASVVYQPNLKISGATVDPQNAELSLSVEGTGSGPAKVKRLQSKYVSDPDDEGLLSYKDENQSEGRLARYPVIRRDEYEGFAPILTSLGGWDDKTIIDSGTAATQNVVEDDSTFRYEDITWHVVPETQKWNTTIRFIFETEPADLLPEYEIELAFENVVAVGEGPGGFPPIYAAEAGDVVSAEAVGNEE